MMLQAFSNPFGTAPLVNHLWQSTVVALAAWLLGESLSSAREPPQHRNRG